MPIDYPNYIYGWGPWIGAQLPNDSIPGKMDTLATLGYNPNNGGFEFAPGAVVGGVPQDTSNPTAKIYLSNEPDWPLKKTNGQDSVLSMLDTRCTYNDWLASQHQVGGRPLKVEVTQATYQWNVAGLRDIIFFLWEIKNTCGDTLRDVYLAPTTDCDIGNESGFYANDLCGVDTTADLAYQYQRDSTEEGWFRNAGCVGFCFLQGPVATKDFAFPDSFHLYAGDTLGLNVFKVFNIGTDALNDIDQYRRTAGYNIQTGEFNRLDTCTNPGDYRFLLSTGPIDIPPGETARAIVSAMCADVDYSFLPGDPLSAISALRQKALDSRSAFQGMVQGTVQITLTSPLGGEVWSGSHDITWTWGGAAQSTDSVDIYYTRDGYVWDTVAVNLPNNGTHSWNTASVPDGVRYRVCAVLHGLGRLACSASQLFIIDNPGNGEPELALELPGSIITAYYLWQWQAGDADGDPLSFDLYVQRRGSASWDKVAGPISSDTANTRVWRQYQYSWATDTMINQDYRLMVECSDGSALVADSTAFFKLHNYHPSHPAGLSSGHSNLPFNWYLLNQANLTGHTYEARFRQFGRGAASILGVYPAEYSYDLWDATAASQLWSGRILPAFMPYSPMYYYDSGAPVDGFVPTCGDTGFTPSLAVVDSVTRPAIDPSVDTLFAEHLTSPVHLGWACLNTPLEVRWHVDGTYPNDTLHAKVWDVAYNVQIPLDTTRLDQLATVSWMFGGTGTGYGRSIITTGTSTVTRMYMNLCGYRLCFNKGSTVYRQMTWATHPQEGDVWGLYFSGDVPPRDGDVFSFTPTGVAGGPDQPAVGNFVLAQNLPNPFARITTINYQITKPGLVSLKVYNVAGQLVRTLTSSAMPAGRYSATWDGRDEFGRRVSAGVYLYRLRANDRALTRRMVLVR